MQKKKKKKKKKIFLKAVESRVTLSTLGKNFSRRYFETFREKFSQVGFDISCKLSSLRKKEKKYYCVYDIFQKVDFCLALYTEEVNLQTFVMI